MKRGSALGAAVVSRRRRASRRTAGAGPAEEQGRGRRRREEGRAARGRAPRRAAAASSASRSRTAHGDARGATVRSVEPDSPAAKAGLKEGDVVVRFDGENVRSAAQLARLVVRDAVRSRGRDRGDAAAARRRSSPRRSTRDADGCACSPGRGGDVFDLEVPEPPEPPEAPGSPGRVPPGAAARAAPVAPHAPAPPHAWSWNWNDGDGEDMLFRFMPGRPAQARHPVHRDGRAARRALQARAEERRPRHLRRGRLARGEGGAAGRRRRPEVRRQGDRGRVRPARGGGRGRGRQGGHAVDPARRPPDGREGDARHSRIRSQGDPAVPAGAPSRRRARSGPRRHRRNGRGWAHHP